MAEDEARRISKRSRAALAAYKARGGMLGASHLECRNLDDGAQRKGSEAMRRRAVDAHRDVLPIMVEMRRDGATLQAIADRLNEDGQLTLRDKPWTAVSVMRVLD